jgi:deoxyadenosine/deoxycytidine kinase
VVIVIGGMIGLGKTTVAGILGEELNIPVYYESVEGNKVLPLFYSSTPEEIQKNRYPFLLQLTFLKSRYHSIKEALSHDNAVLDRSIYEDHYFASKNHDMGRISDLEMETYTNLLEEMLSDIKGMPKKAPDVMIYLKGSFDTVLNRIKTRGRSYEIDPALVSYYHFLWEDYDQWVYNSYKASPIIIVDVDKTDILLNPRDRAKLISDVKQYCKNPHPIA